MKFDQQHETNNIMFDSCGENQPLYLILIKLVRRKTKYLEIMRDIDAASASLG